MEFTEAMQKHLAALMEELIPIAERINKLSNEGGYNMFFVVDGVEVKFRWWDEDRVSALSHIEFRELNNLSDEALAGVLRLISQMSSYCHNRGKEIGKLETQGGIKAWLGLDD